MLPARLILALALTIGAVCAVSGAGSARIAIIIDDLGNSRELGHEAVALPGALTYSVLPMRPFSRYVADTASANGKEVMLHLPMESVDGHTMGPGGLHLGMDRDSLVRTLRASLDSVPHAAGVNNHMGSLLTRHPTAMRWVMEELGCFDRLYFVDSRTDVRTVAREFAREAGLANAQRDVFLDNQLDRDYIRAQLARLIAIARRRGSAIGIGHPSPETLEVLADELPRLAQQGIQLVPVSRLVDSAWSERLWHASSSPLQKVAKSSKP